MFGFKVGCLSAAARFGTVVLGFSSGTNDTSQLRLRSLALLASVVVFGLLFLSLSVAALFVPSALTSWLLLLFAILAAYAFFRIYGWFYHANRFDLMNVPRQ